MFIISYDRFYTQKYKVTGGEQHLNNSDNAATDKTSLFYLEGNMTGFQFIYHLKGQSKYNGIIFTILRSL